ncbi:M16 family metallopeptidase [Intestinibacter bartlettii]|uniref:M16 family metallopeptidase n=1 Tax=Intestinibacter bartlettii TaxID=261299 RepID=UPI001D129E68|nr:pitrilysin family protein [Intestinibacter bartlettii]MCC2705446.1 insulinase family protein [Intestinibacter bartlettii]MCC2760896.1 insulinase family protein [Intestinibacter bartlettii]
MYKCQTLEKGLTIIGEEIPYLKSISLGIWVKAGSIIETKENSGVSHFIEHMLFKGTKNRSSKELAREIDNLGGILNAFTSKECTCFYVKLLDEHIDIGIDVLSDMILNSCFDKKDIEKEKSVILEELKMYEDSPDDLSYDLLLENIYKDHSLGMNILGDRNTLKNFKRENILDYYNKYYVPNNSVISICGNFNFEEIVEKIKDKFKTWEAKEASINTTEPKFNPCIIKKNKDIKQVNLAINLKAIPMINDREVYALSVVNNVFGGSISSRLFQKIREEKGLVYSIYSSQTLYQECGELGIFASTSNENVEEVYKLILDEIDLIRNEYISLQEIHESKEQLKGSYMLDRESTSSRMMSNGKNLLMRNKVDDEQDIIDYINNVEYQDVVEIIEKVFNKENIGVCIVGKDVENISL